MGKIRIWVPLFAVLLALFASACAGREPVKTRSMAELESRGFTSPRPARGPEEAQNNTDTKVYWANAGTCRFTFTLTKKGNVTVDVGGSEQPVANLAILRANAQKWGIQSCFKPQPAKS